MKKILGLALLTGLLIFGSSSLARASDNVTGVHWHSKNVTYNINSNMPSSWIGASAEAAKAWTDRAALKFNRGSDTTSTDPSTSQHVIWNGSVPSSWQSGCPPSTTLACAGTSWDGSNHLLDADLVYNSAEFSLGTNSLWCTLDIGYDVQTIGLHELGHWGYLGHSSDSGAAMYGGYNDCQRTPAQHDIDSMNSNYAGH